MSDHTYCKRISDAEIMQRKVQERPWPPTQYCIYFVGIDNNTVSGRVKESGVNLQLIHLLRYRRRLPYCMQCVNYLPRDYPPLKELK